MMSSVYPSKNFRCYGDFATQQNLDFFVKLGGE